MSEVIRISEAASLAVHATVFLASNGSSTHSNKDIAEALQVSSAHLCKVLRSLSRAGILKSTRGPFGGFVLERDPADVTLLEVYESVEGPLAGKTCLMSKPLCEGDRCIFGGFLKTMTLGMKEYLARTTLSDVKGIVHPSATA